MRTALFLAGVFRLALARDVVVSHTDPCLRYEPDTVRITGVLNRHMFYGAPGFGETPERDAQETGFYLDLAHGVCTTTGRHEDTDSAMRDVRQIQLVLDSAGYAALRPLLGKSVTVRGTLFAGFTGHHHAPLVLDVVKPVVPEATRRDSP